MSNIENPYAVAHLNAWFEENRQFYAQYTTGAHFKDSGRGSASVRLETPRYFIEVCVWDHASCLDVQILNVETGESVFPYVGHCESKSEFENRLNNVVSRLEKLD
jgi:hypothetical protein